MKFRSRCCSLAMTSAICLSCSIIAIMLDAPSSTHLDERGPKIL
jgi:hypothetical protein